MAGLFDILQAVEFFTEMYGAYEQTQFDEKERQLAIERHDEAKDIHGELRGRVLPSIAKLGKEQMGMLEGSGVQQKKDVRRRTRERVDSALSNLNRRGLGNTTVGASLQKGYGEFEEDQLARIDEQVRQERMQTHGYWGLLGNQLDVDLTGQQINILAGRQIPPQQSFALRAGEVLAAHRPAPEAPEAPGTDIATPLIAGGVGIKTAGVIAGPFSAGLLAACIDGDAIVTMPGKQRMLKDIKVGDKVLNSRGEFVEVVWADYGRPAEVSNYVELSCGANRLIATTDHHVGGKTVGEWGIGEEMELYNGKFLIEGIKNVGWVLCGDIRLVDDSDYIANGFVVTSQLARASATWARELEGKLEHASSPAPVPETKAELCHT